MSDHWFFGAQLRDAPPDHAARLLYAEWLADRGDPHASGHRWLAAHGKYPDADEIMIDDILLGSWLWRTGRSEDPAALPPEVAARLTGYYYVTNRTDGTTVYDYLRHDHALEEAVRAVIAAGVRG